MRLEARRIAAFLRDPGACRVVLLYGEDAGLIRERADALVSAAAGARDDPFRVVELEPKSLADLPAEAAGLPLTGGRRVVRAREVADSALSAVQAVLNGRGTALVVLEAPDLPARSRLRSLLDGAADGVAIGCYPEEGRSLQTMIRAQLADAGVSIDNEALAWVSSQVGADQALTRQELTKLALYAGPGGRIDLAAASDCVGEAAGISLDDALFAATEGDIATLDRALELALEAGLAPAAALRAGLSHLQRLHRASLMVASGVERNAAMRATRPPVFWRRERSFLRALDIWKPPALATAIASLAEAERGTRRTGAPDTAICRHALFAIARSAAMAVRRGH
jgi:DNA polymerase-3 subunit delta